MLSNDLLSQLNKQYNRQILEDLVKINSVIGQEGALVEFIRNEFEKLGINSELDEVESGRPNIYARLEGDNPGKRLHFNGHTDTIPVVNGWETDPFTPVIKEGKLFGLGTCDMKAGIACIINMFKAFVDSNHSFSGELSFSGVIDEEGYSKGAKALLKTEYRHVDAIVLAEPFPGDETKPIPLGITGKVLYDIHVKGKAAHGFSPHHGINAIEELGSIIANLKNLSFKKHSEFGTGNYSTIKIEGGYEVYSVVVPASARAEINRLLVPGETVQTATTDMEELIQSLNLQAKVEIKTKLPLYQPFMITKNQLIFQIFQPIYTKIMGKAPQYGYTTGITDANVFVGEGKIPCLHLGPHQEVAHQKNEYVDLDWLPKLSEMYTLIAGEFLS